MEESVPISAHELDELVALAVNAAGSKRVAWVRIARFELTEEYATRIVACVVEQKLAATVRKAAAPKLRTRIRIALGTPPFEVPDIHAEILGKHFTGAVAGAACSRKLRTRIGITGLCSLSKNATA